MLQKVIKFVRDEEGASAVEYGLIIGLIAVALVVVLTLLGGGLDATYKTICNAIKPGTC